ncbi:Bacterial leucyl aminopeptidase precursor [Legionella massiliensis]|uniref:Bacterial leucyl aminopeptidase n=1 Tax=Legionella massiliensis TaxID=1034943 RepID=A0A078KSD0_9GAMM|nr:M20/M25/M40 family metallo-hydrolase [Legionella massiliensis]CDZ75961.1 Bacterial leucyl aminopeptidase precursor [Legionella massiliensis]CEE11699.1 Bacterial leucyl aminopeptidase precursor [Legionella massiliensis]
MHLPQIILNFILSLCVLSPVFAQAQNEMEQLQIPQCLAAKLDKNYSILAENKNFKIINIPAAEVDELALLADQVACGRFKNLSHQSKEEVARALLQPATIKVPAYKRGNYRINHREAVYQAIAKIDSTNIWQTLSHLTSYHNRFAKQETGYQTALWLQNQFEDLARSQGRHDTATYLVETGNDYIQPSVVTVIGKDLKAPAVVIGAHMDTLAGRMPGAGDDASGSATILEMARVLLASENHLKHPVYIIWYAAEESGLLGSQRVVAYFKERAIKVKAVVQFDMTGFRHQDDDPTMWLFLDNTEPGLTAFTAQLIEEYIKVPVAYSSCGYSCSDHASWSEAGFSVVFPCETSFEDHNPFMHTSSDTMNLLNTEHMVNFTKLALAFAIELAGS